MGLQLSTECSLIRVPYEPIWETGPIYFPEIPGGVILLKTILQGQLVSWSSKLIAMGMTAAVEINLTRGITTRILFEAQNMRSTMNVFHSG